MTIKKHNLGKTDLIRDDPVFILRSGIKYPFLSLSADRQASNLCHPCSKIFVVYSSPAVRRTPLETGLCYFA